MFFSVGSKNNGVLALYYPPVDHPLSDGFCSPELLRFNGQLWRNLEQLKRYMCAWESGNTDWMDRLLSVNRYTFRDTLSQAKLCLEGSTSDIYTSDTLFYTPDERLLNEIRFIQRRWQDDSTFRHFCCKHWLPRHTVFCLAHYQPTWGVGKKYGNILENQSLRYLRGRNMKGWLITFMTYLNCQVDLVLAEFPDATYVQALRHAFRLTEKFYHSQPQCEPKWYDVLEGTNIFKGLVSLLKFFEKYHQIISREDFWLSANAGSFNLETHGIKAIMWQWTKDQMRPETHWTQRYNSCASGTCSSSSSNSSSVQASRSRQRRNKTDTPSRTRKGHRCGGEKIRQKKRQSNKRKKDRQSRGGNISSNSCSSNSCSSSSSSCSSSESDSDGAAGASVIRRHSTHGAKQSDNSRQRRRSSTQTVPSREVSPPLTLVQGSKRLKPWTENRGNNLFL